MAQNLEQSLHDVLQKAFIAAGYAAADVKVQASDRPDLADFQCNSAFQLAKAERKNPRELAQAVVDKIDTDFFEKVEVAGAGFINLVVKKQNIADSLADLNISFSDAIRAEKPLNIVLDYGGPNVAKPLHVGHLRPAIIGESLKRIARAVGHHVVGDVHLGDWGTPMGMLIAELKDRHSDWVFFDADYQGEYPQKAPFNADDLKLLYPQASARFKNEEDFAERARQATAELQTGRRGYTQLLHYFRTLSIEAMQQDYKNLNVSFDLWLGESSVNDAMQKMVDELVQKNIAEDSRGAKIIRVARPDDKEEFPPLILVKNDGAYNYATSDLATIRERVFNPEFNMGKKPDEIWYVVDRRQSLHFKQVFRAAHMAGFIDEKSLRHIGNGTVNGPDGKPFKTRDGGMMSLSELIAVAEQEAMVQSGFSETDLNDELRLMIKQIAIAAIKYGDLSARLADYIFDVKAFVQAEGKTGPYIQYAAVRIKSIIDKAGLSVKSIEAAPLNVQAEEEKTLGLTLLNYSHALHKSLEQSTPGFLCDHLYAVAREFNRFYKACPVLAADDEATRLSRLRFCQCVLQQIEHGMQALGIDIPDRMLRADKQENAA